jgi:hypothetical protein
MHQTVARGFGLGVPLDISGWMPLIPLLMWATENPVK